MPFTDPDEQREFRQELRDIGNRLNDKLDTLSSTVAVVDVRLARVEERQQMLKDTPARWAAGASILTAIGAFAAWLFHKP